MSHQRKQTDGFQRHCFPACIWPGNDKNVEILPHFQIEWNDLFGISKFQKQNRMPSISNIQNFFGDFRFLSMKAQCKPRFCMNEIQQCQSVQIFFDVEQMHADEAGQIPKDSGNFPCFLKMQLPNAIVHFNNFKGFHKKGSAGCGMIVNQALNSPAVFFFQGQNHSPLAHGNHRILKHVVVGFHNRGHAFTHPIGGAVQLFSNCRQLGRGLILHPQCVHINGVIYYRFQIPKRVKARDKF